MDNYDDIDNNWGNKHSDYYEGRYKKENDNFIEEEEAAIKLQQAKLKKLKEMNLLDSEDEAETQKEKEPKIKKKLKGKAVKPAKNSESHFDLNSSGSDSELKKNKKSKALNKEEKEEMLQILKNVKLHINEIEENTTPIIEILKTESLDDKLTNTISYLKFKKNLHLIYTIYNLFSLNYKNQKNISDHHPVWKKILMTKNHIDGLKEKNSKIFGEIDNLLQTIEQNKNLSVAEDLESSNDPADDNEDEQQEESSIENEDVVEQKFLNRKRTKDFITETKNKLTQLKEKKKQKIEKEKDKIMKEVDNKNLLGQRLANENILKARGLFRKRKKYQGNARLHLREKYYKKEKLRKNMVKEYTGKPEVYGGEATGIRTHLIRSTNIR